MDGKRELDRTAIERPSCPQCPRAGAGAWNCVNCGVAFNPDTGELLEEEEG